MQPNKNINIEAGTSPIHLSHTLTPNETREIIKCFQKFTTSTLVYHVGSGPEELLKTPITKDYEGKSQLLVLFKKVTSLVVSVFQTHAW